MENDLDLHELSRKKIERKLKRKAKQREEKLKLQTMDFEDVSTSDLEVDSRMDTPNDTDGNQQSSNMYKVMRKHGKKRKAEEMMTDESSSTNVLLYFFLTTFWILIPLYFIEKGTS